MFLYITNSPEETFQFGQKIAKILQPGMVILLSGKLGAGKTCFASGIIQGLGVKDYVTSPTFSLINQYSGRLSVAHMDLYRLTQPSELFDLGFTEYLDGHWILLVEWPERAEEYLPNTYLKVQISAEGEQREFSLVSSGEEYVELIEEMRELVSIGD